MNFLSRITHIMFLPPPPRMYALDQNNFYSGDFIDRSASGLVGLTNQGMPE